MGDPGERLVSLSAGSAGTTPARVGAKAWSLLRLTEAGFDVPPGAVLTTGFFAPWLELARASPAWGALDDASPAERPALCQELVQRCASLPLTDAQRDTLAELRGVLPGLDQGAPFAVRSSAPDEDLESASFAGGYATRLGVRGRGLERALAECAASVFEERVFAYRRERGLDTHAPRIAVVVQEQIASEVAGVGFSLNPATNDYDEAVVDASWGLGESVVAGLAEPDHFVIDKTSGALLERRLGAKRVSVWLAPDGGTERREGYRSAEPCLGDAQLRELGDVLCRIEDLFGHPVDMEWAWAEGRLRILQARPVTAWVPLPAEMLTQPGERRRLYTDAALSKGMTLNAPISTLGLAWMDEMVSDMLARFIEIEGSTPADALVFSAGNRFYMNLSNAMWLGVKPDALARSTAPVDSLLADILGSIRPEVHRAERRPPWARLRLLLRLPGVVWSLRGFFWTALRTFLAPQRAHRAYLRRVEALEHTLREELDYALPLGEFARTYGERVGREMFGVTMPALLAGLVSPDVAVWRASPEARALAEKLKRGFPGNLVVEQGIALFRLARRLERSDFDDLDALAERIRKRALPGAFLEEWDAFMRRFGCRGPGEMDVASPRYADDPQLALQQMSGMAVDEPGLDPELAHRRTVEARRMAYAELLRRSGWLRRLLLRRIHVLIELFAGTRDTPKYHAVLLTFALRKRALIEGERLVRAGRLDAPRDVFDLEPRDLEAAAADPALDLRRLRAERTRFARRLAACVTEFPQVIDSRGRILRPPAREGKPGELVGMPVSPGVARGPVRVLRDPRGKTVEKGDVLVAYATDPGWTPLFLNAAAIVLEVGGILQHGAVIAREFGKPCVTGIDRVVATLRDGQLVEVDGTAGVVRLLDDARARTGSR